MQIRTLAAQKQRDGIWTASLILACVSIVIQLLSLFVLYLTAKGDIRNAQQQPRLERYNTLALIIIILIAVINVVINIFMITINPKSFLDTRSLEILQQKN